MSVLAIPFPRRRRRDVGHLGLATVSTGLWMMAVTSLRTARDYQRFLLADVTG